MQKERNQDATVFIVDDEEPVRTGLQRFLHSEGYVTETFASAEEFLGRIPIKGVGCLLLDIQMPGLSGIELQERLVELECMVPIVFLTAVGDIPTSVKAIKRGAENFLSKLADSQNLLNAVDGALERSRAKQGILKLAEQLTDREREICSYVIAGMLNKQIGYKLGIVERTVKAHRAKVMEKFGVTSVAELVRLAEQAGLKEAYEEQP